MTLLDDFLALNIEAYLFEDLRALKEIAPLPGRHGGGVGYPLLLTAFAGIELLGALTSLHPFNLRTGENYFVGYWRRFLYPGRSETDEAPRALYQLARHGLAHAFVVKGNIVVSKGQSATHLTSDDLRRVWIDGAQLADDLIASYRIRVLPLVASSTGEPSSSTMAQRLSEIETAYVTQSERQNVESHFPGSTRYSSGGSTSVSGLIIGPVPSQHPEINESQGPTGPSFPRRRS